MKVQTYSKLCNQHYSKKMDNPVSDRVTRSKRRKLLTSQDNNQLASNVSTDVLQDIIDQIENSRNISNQDDLSNQNSLPERVDSGNRTEKTVHDESETEPSTSRPIRPLLRSKTSTQLKKIEEQYNSLPKRILNKKSDGFYPFDRVRPTYLLKNAFTSHRLEDILKLYILITKDQRTCPYLLSKTGFVLFRQHYGSRSAEEDDELCKDMVSFVKHLRFYKGLPTAEFFLDFLVFCYETGNEKLVEELGDLNEHVVEYYHLYINQMRQCFKMFIYLTKFITFFKQFREDGMDYKRYQADEFHSKDLTHICLLISKLTTGPENDYPLDYIFLCLIDLLILFEKKKKAKKLLIKYQARHPTNLNAIIYVLKFNELYLGDADLFKESYNGLLRLDPSNKCLIDYISYLSSNLESLKVLLNYVDYTMNKDDIEAWKLIYGKLIQIKENSQEEKAIQMFYKANFSSYWPTYQFTTLTVKINPENCDFLFHKAFVFNYFQPVLSVKFVSQINLILTITKSDKIEILNGLKFTNPHTK